MFFYKNIFLLILPFLLNFIGCKSDKSSSKSNSNQYFQLEGKQCFDYINAEDTIQFNLNSKNQKCVGTYSVQFAKMVLKKYDFIGHQQDTLLVGFLKDQTTNAVKEACFLILPNSLSEGIGAQLQKNDTMFFENSRGLIFNNVMKVVQTSCK